MDRDDSDDDDMNHIERTVYCIWKGKNEEAMQLLQEIDYCDFINPISGKTLLHVAAGTNNVTIAQYLIDRKWKIDAVDDCGNTPLIIACQENYTDVIKALVEAKASVLISNNDGKSAAKIVLGGADLNVFILNPVIKRVKEECSNDSLRTAKELLRIGCSLTRALRLRDVEITKYMLENGCNINDQDHQLRGWTPLHQALGFEDNENVKLLIDRGADVNIEDDDGMTPVRRAFNFEILEILLNKGAKVVGDDGTLIASGLFYCWDRVVVEMLIERYNLRDFSIKDRRGTTLFHHIVSNEAFDPVDILQKHYDYRFNIDQRDHEGSSALLCAVKAGNVGTVDFLLKKGAKFIAKNVYDDEISNVVGPHVWKENREDREKILMLLLQYGADVQWSCEHRGNQYFTLSYVLIHQHYAMVKIILARLALVEDLGGEIKTVYREKIEHDVMCKKYYEFCKRTIEKLKKTVIKRRVTLFDLQRCSRSSTIRGIPIYITIKFCDYASKRLSRFWISVKASLIS